MTTRYATVRLDLDDGHTSFGEDIDLGEPAVTRKRMIQFNPVDDESVVMLYRFRGDVDQARGALEATPEVFKFDVVHGGHGENIAYVHCALQDPVKSIISTIRQYEIVIDMPLVFPDDGSIRARLIGEDSTLGDVLDALTEIVGVHLEKTGRYHPELSEVGITLTDRQHQILTVAVERGYYEVPRQSTIEDIASEIALSRATVSEHLQKIEAGVLPQLVR